MKRALFLLILVGGCAALLPACSEDTADEAGEAVEDALEGSGDAVKESVEKLEEEIDESTE